MLFGGWLAYRVVELHRDLNTAISEVDTARDQVGKGDYAGAAQSAARAAGVAREARSISHGLVFAPLRIVPWVGTQVDAARDLSSAAAALTSSGHSLIAAAASSPLITSHGASGAGLSNLTTLAAQLKPITGPLTSMDAAVTSAQKTVTRLKGDGLIGPIANALNRLNPQLTKVSTAVTDAQAALQIIDRGAQPGPPMRLLFLAQDTYELRPSGGFIGSYGILDIGAGKLKLVSYSDATNLPYPKPALHPPDPLDSNLKHPWTLTGAGWWPDFPTTAKAAEQLYQASGGTPVDGVLASTQQFLQDLLRATGTTLTVPGYPDVVTAANLPERVLYNVEVKKPHDNPRKKFLTLLTQELFNHLESLHGSAARAALGPLGSAFTSRHLQMYLNDPTMQAAFVRAGWAGVLAPPAKSDVLALADADFGTDKATENVHKTITYTVTRLADGRLVADETIVTADTGAKSTLNPSYTSYLRAYVPPGSVLVDASDHTRDVTTSSESGFTTYGLGQTIQPKSSGTRHLVYYLPSDVVSHGVYNLLIRPQAGTPNDTFIVNLDLNKTRVTKRFNANSGDQTVSLRLSGAAPALPAGQPAPDAPWFPVPPVTPSKGCIITIPRSAADSPAATAQQRIEETQSELARYGPEMSALQAQGCPSVYLQTATK